MQSKPKSNSVITHTVEGTHITFRVEGAGDVGLEMTALAPEVLERAAVHGMIQRISDAAAISRNPETGKSATPAEKLAAMRALVDHYMTGTSEWGRKRAGGGAVSGGVLARALHALNPQKSLDEVRAWLKTKSPAERAALRVTQKVAEKIAELTAGGGDGEAILAELVEGGE